MSQPTVLRPSAFQSPARKIRLLLAELPVFAGLLSEDGTVLECNFAPLGGLLEEKTQWIGKPFETGPWWSYSEDSRSEILIMLGLARKGERVSRERLYRRPDGEMGVMMLSLIPLFAPYGQPDAIMVVAVDVTERRRETDSSDQIASDMSHRLRNSFTVMRALATRTEDKPESDDAPSILSRRLSRIRNSHALCYRYLFFDVPLQDILSTALPDNAPVTYDAYEPVSVSSDHVETLMMAFGELALVGSEATVDVVHGGEDGLTVRWREKRARDESDIPRGLSEVLTISGPSSKTGGHVDVTNDETGFAWTLTIPSTALGRSRNSAA